ncbi:MAG: efflux RND transporter periplasmic adaptor subunit [Comamonadaceae bacterium]|nr:efflux RND transporter periplasmic adaptor subunit [Comamonadaceae bacterium]
MAAFAVLVLAGGVAAAADVVRLTPEQGKALGIETVALVPRQAGEIQGLPAEVTVPNRQLHAVAAPLAGLVEHVAVAANATVKKGELLARLQSPQLAEIQRGLLQAATQLQLAKDNLERDDELLKEGIIAASRQRATKSQHAEAAAAYAERRQALRLRRLVGGGDRQAAIGPRHERRGRDHGAGRRRGSGTDGHARPARRGGSAAVQAGAARSPVARGATAGGAAERSGARRGGRCAGPRRGGARHLRSAGAWAPTRRWRCAPKSRPARTSFAQGSSWKRAWQRRPPGRSAGACPTPPGAHGRRAAAVRADGSGLPRAEGDAGERRRGGEPGRRRTQG